MHPLAEAVAERRRHERPGAAVRAILDAANVTETEVAKALNVAPVTVSRWLSGQRRPRGELARAYADLVDDLERAVSS
jgi:transcriptional regulator with XRE-family HTH domain